MLLLACLTLAAVTPNDTGSLVAALAAAQPGETVNVPPGIYPVTTTLKVPTGVHLLGDGGDRSILRWAGEKPGAMLSVSGVADVEIGLLYLDAAGSPDCKRGIMGSNSQRVHLHDLRLAHFGSGSGPIAIHFSGRNPTREGGVTDSVIEDCRIEDVGQEDQWGAGIRLSWGSSRNQVLRNVIDGTGRGGILTDNGSQELVIRDNTINHSGGTGLGIEVWGGCDKTLIEDNRIDHWLSCDSSSYSAVRRNVIVDRSGVIKGLGIECVATSYSVFTDNRVEDGQSIGLSASNKAPKLYNYWGNNLFANCNQWGAQLQGEAGGVAFQYLYRCRFIDNPAGKGTPRYPNDAGHGFRTNGNAHHLTLEECEISGNGKLGLQLGGAEVDFLSFVRCKIENNGSAAVSGPSKATALEFVDCTVSGNRSDKLPDQHPFPHPAPTALFECPDELHAGQPATFNSMSTAAAGAIQQCLWDFGEGLPETTSSATHTYPRPGTYQVTLLVWDSAGRGARTARTLRVE